MTILQDAPTPETNNDSPASQPATTHEVILERVGMGSGGGRYSVTYRGEVICISPDPEFGACRELAKRGISGRLVTRWKGSPHTALTMGIAWGAVRRTEETRKSGPKYNLWNPSYAGASAEDTQDAVSAFPVGTDSGRNESEGT